MPGPLFGVIPAGQPLITEPASTPSPESCLYALPSGKPFSHIVVLLLPNALLPENTAAAIYLASARDVAAAAQTNSTPDFKFLGGVGAGKESAIFKVGAGQGGEGQDSVMIGVSIEPEEAVGRRLQELAANKSSMAALSPGRPQPPTVVLAQRIIQNAFNFLASFSGSTGSDGVEIVPLKAFEEWWRKFESRVRSDPSFLEAPSE